MPKTKAQKQEAVSEMQVMIERSNAVFVVAPENVNPNEAAELKIKLAEVGGEYHLVKNSLFKLAVEAAGLEYSEDFANGQNAMVLAGDQSPEVAKIVKEFIKDTEKAKFKSGYFEEKLVSSDQVNAIAELPSREQLLSQVLATMQAPVSGFVRVLNANTRDLVYVLAAIQDQKNS